MEAQSPFYMRKQGVASASLASTMHSMALHSMALALPPPAAMGTDEAAAKQLILLEWSGIALLHEEARSGECISGLDDAQCIRLLTDKPRQDDDAFDGFGFAAPSRDEYR